MIIKISTEKIDEIEKKLHEDAWNDETVDAEAIDAYLGDFVTMINEEAKED